MLTSPDWRALAKVLRKVKPGPKAAQVRHLDWEDLVEEISIYVHDHADPREHFDAEAFDRSVKISPRIRKGVTNVYSQIV